MVGPVVNRVNSAFSLYWIEYNARKLTYSLADWAYYIQDGKKTLHSIGVCSNWVGPAFRD